ncbi:hypothetical protein [Burkholderia mayonis]|uniref:Uncharacterized protein n=1 Tax=Burkholderia mayonis TaxID=1385591 RepID=A0A1B4G443_9BURK|nr:hypothetical protein [Burkholderia mayonis]AOJ10681.1 hypothetical protein WS71_26290 [Burkholderia mayonis]KVE53132.1 hypothetical protein WS71_07650 [Burkholderia mayonis]
MSATASDDFDSRAADVASARVTGRCVQCRHRDARRGGLEQAIAGLGALGSGYGSSVADSRLCRRHDRFVSPDDGCFAFSPLKAGLP